MGFKWSGVQIAPPRPCQGPRGAAWPFVLLSEWLPGSPEAPSGAPLWPCAPLECRHQLPQVPPHLPRRRCHDSVSPPKDRARQDLPSGPSPRSLVRRAKRGSSGWTRPGSEESLPRSWEWRRCLIRWLARSGKRWPTVPMGPSAHLGSVRARRGDGPLPARRVPLPDQDQSAASHIRPRTSRAPSESRCAARWR